MKSRRWFLVAGVAAVVVATVGLWRHRVTVQPEDSGGVASAPAPAAPEPAPQAPPAAAPAALPAKPRPAPPPAARPAPLSDAENVKRLRELGTSDPARSLQLAREGIAQYPQSPDAAERTWFLIRALSATGSGDEARAEARKMAAAYPDASWTGDVVRHVLALPP